VDTSLVVGRIVQVNYRYRLCLKVSTKVEEFITLKINIRVGTDIM
jgi:hypothetical protein